MFIWLGVKRVLIWYVGFFKIAFMLGGIRMWLMWKKRLLIFFFLAFYKMLAFMGVVVLKLIVI